MNDNGQRSWIIKNKTEFLHEFKGLAKILREHPGIETKRRIGRDMASKLFQESGALQYCCDQDLSGEARIIYAQFAAYAQLAIDTRADLEEDLEEAEHLGGRETVIQEFYEEIKDITDKAIITYEELHQKITQKEQSRQEKLKTR